MAPMTIGEVAARAGVNPTAIRYWEREGVLPPPRRVGGQRRYDDAVLARLAVVRAAQAVGFTVAETRALVDGFDGEGVAPARWRELAARKLAEVDALIARAEGMKRLLVESLACGCVTLDACELVRQAAERPPRPAQPPSPSPGTIAKPRAIFGPGA
jgi:MerR family redox-sensitive transcriptional activator SoxR